MAEVPPRNCGGKVSRYVSGIAGVSENKQLKVCGLKKKLLDFTVYTSKSKHGSV